MTPTLSTTIALDFTEFGVAAMNAVSAIRYCSHWSGFVDPVGERTAVA